MDGTLGSSWGAACPGGFCWAAAAVSSLEEEEEDDDEDDDDLSSAISAAGRRLPGPFLAGDTAVLVGGLTEARTGRGSSLDGFDVLDDESLRWWMGVMLR